MSMKKMLAVVAAVSLVAAPAFAANPFSDVPMNHWAYDAVEQLSAKGILEGYPNGTFKGNKSMTRYEIATMVARMMANGGASGADLEKLKALVVEFQPELEALGVKVDGFDARISKLEKNLGGLKIWGQMRFDYHAWDNTDKEKNSFNFSRARLFARKELSDNVSWEMRWHNDNIDRYWMTMKDAFGVKGLTAKLGQFALNWEGPDGLFTNGHLWDDDAFFFDSGIKGVELAYKKGALTLDSFYATGLGNGENGVYDANNKGLETYGARIRYDAAKWFLAGNFYHFNGLKAAEKPEDCDFDTQFKVYNVNLGLKLVKGLDIVGAFYKEDIASASANDSPKAWKVVVDMNKDLLKFTSLRAEYATLDKGFIKTTAPIYGNGIKNNATFKGSQLKEDLDVISLKAVQQWTKKFGTFERWGKYDMDNVGDAKQWSIGVTYQYSPALLFVVDYTDFDGKLTNGTVKKADQDNVIRFRSVLSF